MPHSDLRIRETNEIDRLAATYICSEEPARPGHGPRHRVDIIPPSKGSSGSYLSSLLEVFLPVGYPHSVSEDYIDCHKAYIPKSRKYGDAEVILLSGDLSSAPGTRLLVLIDPCGVENANLNACGLPPSSKGLLASRAVLQGVGVGDSTASPTAALLLSVFQDSMGRIATILFAHRLGTSIEPECKMYRLAADVFNDSAMIFDCMSPIFPKPLRVILLSLSSVLRALCGVAAGSAKASLSVHFARRANLGELNAKDSSQETVISLLGMLVGSVVVSHISTPLATWITLLSLLSIHLATNYAAVRAVKMTTLNRQRANIVFSTLFNEGRALTPDQVSRRERIFERDGILRWKASSTTYGSCQIGAAMRDLFLSIGDSTSSGNYIRDIHVDIRTLIKIFEQENYILWYNKESRRATIVLKAHATPATQLKAWSHALIVSRLVSLESLLKQDGQLVREKTQLITQREKNANPEEGEGGAPTTMLAILQRTLSSHSGNFSDWTVRLGSVGWDLNTPVLETRPGTRLEVERDD
ncbi:hypothetical protein AJ80_00770 [Polytolypa hystricis UAMH7299]|uniref:DUF647 domain-containing protein n=1 Tax=Polytolypa hystricis (strain UAMH7299) TaxID=1447883 RepID=A0A2B7Z2R4_POLH7|nr:hypothetical protein AJ80_00770 [Polytolypa hystricis UAMH7299]